MSKDAFYFPHDSNARHDPRIIKLRMRFGLEGYAIYFMLLEVLRDSKGYKISEKELDAIEFDLKITDLKAFFSYCIEIGLFEKKGSFLGSPSFYKRMKAIDLRRSNLRKAGLRGVEARLNHGLSSKEKKSKEKKSKGEGSKGRDVTPPSRSEILEYADQHGLDQKVVNNFWLHYESTGWLSGKYPIQNWKARLMKWIENEYTDSSPVPGPHGTPL